MDIGPILFLDTETTWRGGEQQVLYLMRGASARGINVHLAASPKGELRTRAGGMCPVVAARMRGDFEVLRLVPGVAAYCLRKKIQILDAHDSRGHLLGFAVKLLMPRLHLVVHRHVDFLPARNVINRVIYRSPRVDRFVAVSEFVAGVLTRYGVGPGRISVVKCSVDGTSFQHLDKPDCRSRLSREFGIPPGRVLIGAVAHLTPQKDHATLLKSLRILSGRGVDFHCLLAGSGDLRKDIESQLDKLGLGRRVTLAGFRQDIPAFLAGLDVFVMASAMEALGTAVLEACHAGVCVVATSAGGIPEVVTHEETGLLSPPGNPELLASNLFRAINQPELRARLGACGRESVAARFPFAKFIEDNLAVYRAVQDRRKPG